MSEILPQKPKTFPYLTIVHERQPRQKMHTALGHAKNAFAVVYGSGKHYTGQLFAWNSQIEDWELLFTVPDQVFDTLHKRWIEARPWKIEETTKKLQEKDEYEASIDKVVQLRIEYDKNHSKAGAWLDAENTLNNYQFTEYQRRYAQQRFRR